MTGETLTKGNQEKTDRIIDIMDLRKRKERKRERTERKREKGRKREKREKERDKREQER